MPDYFVPLDTTGYSDYYSNITQKALVYHFAFDYTDKHRAELTKLTSPEQFAQTLKKKRILDQFVSYAEEKGVKRNAGDLKISAEIIETQVIAYRNNFV